ncbi:MAG TPA: sigma-70 family RNA polymerase sigma factor [Rhodanobacteraceae bacterium]|jgi:RNA polymerase sigma-70 factor (ECF subfamily)|nr:sigma-70 family RNA polymerase sigma factor [Rhodanobacteraceae bacterium]
MTDETDAELVARCSGGDRRAFDAILARYERQLFGAAFRILHNREDAFDVTQTAFMRAYEHLDRYDPDQSFHTWLYRIAVNAALDVIRARHPRDPLSDEIVDQHGGPDTEAMRGQRDAVLQAALMELKVEQRTVVVLKHLQGFSYEEIAQVLECPVKTVKSRLFTARQSLRSILASKGRL